jgi:hypothetical protein
MTASQQPGITAIEPLSSMRKIAGMAAMSFA